jgi:LDH2 family malate/lactate/ureidoglycolate dehydrogenase
VAAEFSMNLAIEQARTTGVGFVATRRSNHFGIAGYYAAMALEHGMIGLCGTNTGPIVAPTFGRTPMLGTNPLAIAAPTSMPPDFLLDMATSAVSGGKLQVAIRAGKPVPHGWGIDATGADSADPGAILAHGALLPLGSFEPLSSYKGFGLAMVVEILAGVLGGGVFGPDVIALTKPQRAGHANVSHVFGAIDIGRFLPLQDFRARMDAWLDAIRSAPRAPGADRIYVPGEKEWELEARHHATGVPLMPPVVEALQAMAARLRVSMPSPVAATGERDA